MTFHWEVFLVMHIQTQQWSQPGLSSIEQWLGYSGVFCKSLSSFGGLFYFDGSVSGVFSTDSLEFGALFYCVTEGCD